MASETKETDLKFYLPLINLILNSHMWLVTIIIDGASIGVCLWFDKWIFFISAKFTNDSIFKIYIKEKQEF